MAYHDSVHCFPHEWHRCHCPHWSSVRVLGVGIDKSEPPWRCNHCHWSSASLGSSAAPSWQDRRGTLRTPGQECLQRWACSSLWMSPLSPEDRPAFQQSAACSEDHHRVASSISLAPLQAFGSQGICHLLCSLQQQFRSACPQTLDSQQTRLQY